MKPRYLKKIEERREKGSLRSLSLFDGMVDFCSNDYLGLAKAEVEPTVYAGSTGSRLISGHSEGAQNTELFLASFFESEAALVFNSGYDANIGFFSSVPQKGDTVLYDEFIHASVRDGIRLSHAQSFSFRHNDVSDLRKKYSKAEGTVYMVVESLYSMDGDIAPLMELVHFCEQNNVLLVVDEAHAGGVFGMEGKGLMHQLNLHQRCFARLITFGKAYGTHGAVVLGTQVLREFLYNFARSFIYTTALPEAQYNHIQHQVELAAISAVRREKLAVTIRQFRSILGEDLLVSDAHSPIQMLPMSSVETCLQLSIDLQENGFAVKAILPPTVPEGGQRIRVCLHSFNTEKEVAQFAAICLNKISN